MTEDTKSTIGVAMFVLFGALFGYMLGYSSGYSGGIESTKRIECEVKYSNEKLKDVSMKCLEYLDLKGMK